MARKLKDIDIHEISLVDYPANKKKFYLRKRSQEMDTLKKQLVAFLGDSEPELVEKFASRNAEEKDLSDALDTLVEFKDDLPPDILKAARAIVKRAMAETEPEDGPIDIAKFGARLSKQTKDRLNEIKACVEKLLAESEGAASTEPEPAAKAAAEGDEKSLPPWVKEKLKRLAAVEAKEAKEAMKKEADEKAALTKRLDDLEKAVAKGTKPFSKSLRGQDGLDTDAPEKKVEKADVFPWSSLVGALGAGEEE
jgi:hypothetical protein